MKTTVDLYTSTGTKQGTLNLPEAVFARPENADLLAQYIRVYLSNQRQGTKATKTRGEVAYSTRKIWRQKGTGRARHGSRKAPIFVKGGVAHGPTGNEEYHLKISKRSKKQALYQALTSKMAQHEIAVLLDPEKISGKTQAFDKLIERIVPKKVNRTLMVLDQPSRPIINAAANLKQVTITQAHRLNAYEVLQHQYIILTQASLEIIAPKKAKTL